MSETMRPLSFGQLMEWLLSEYSLKGSIFGVHEIYKHNGSKSLPIFREKIETPFGPAAGPHTQLAQNIIAAYAGGSRFFEVKTVQVMDGEELAACIARPCINTEDEGYNVEWSTELTVPQALSEYIKAWFAIKLISREFGFGDPDGFVFNMSVGYDLKGISSEKIDAYIEGMRNAENTSAWQECMDWSLENAARFKKADAEYIKGISPRVCDSITISTLHGCPPDEIERIARYLISEKGLNTYIKCNPTLLGYDFARSTMDSMGYDYLVFDDHHFKNDLQYSDALPMLTRLIGLASEKGVEFGVKLTNTFPVKIARGELPGEEMYMSGKSLYPLSISLAEKLETDFDGKLRVSYSGGADYFNIGEIFGCGVWPITMATTILKTGGYNRLKQIAEKVSAMDYAPFKGVDLPALSALAQSARTDRHHIKPEKFSPIIKAEGKVPLTNCFIAGCHEACPIHQDIPAYLELTEQGRYLEALSVICEKNPLPFITGTICSHRCQSACARNFYEESVHIREAKLKAAEGGFEEYLEKLEAPLKNGRRIAVIGGGPAGMAAAFFAARAGAEVTIFEEKESLGGVVRYVIPSFRIDNSAIDNDIKMLNKLGVAIKTGTRIQSADELKDFDSLILACGAWAHDPLKLEIGSALNVIEFLEQAKKSPSSLGIKGSVAVIGAGNTAMDAARAAKRLPGVDNVCIVYRRTVSEMPADLEELELAKADGVELLELLSPLAHKNGKLTCEIMTLGERGKDGRRRPVPTGKTRELDADTVISAIGEKPDAELIGRFKGCAVIGDAKRGPATVVEAIADAQAAVSEILGIPFPADTEMQANADELRARRGKLCHSEECDNMRCLGCSAVCESCADVCPNRANVSVSVNGKAQILHIDRLCNECGNCAAFCPYSGEPYRDKLTLFSTREDFDASPKNSGFLPLENGRVLVRIDGSEYEAEPGDSRIPSDIADIIAAVLTYTK